MLTSELPDSFEQRDQVMSLHAGLMHERLDGEAIKTEILLMKDYAGLTYNEKIAISNLRLELLSGSSLPALSFSEKALINSICARKQRARA